jgi:hypothetical protein
MMYVHVVYMGTHDVLYSMYDNILHLKLL